MTARRITIVASELLGRPGTGGAGTADSLLAVALARHGHQVDLLIASGREIGQLSPEWTSRYESAGVSVRVLERLPGVRPQYLAPTLEVFRALRDGPPEVAIADDWRGLAYAALRARQTALALRDTAFVIHCHGPGRVLTEFAQKVPDTLERFGEGVIERASIECADAVVSPTRWVLDWMCAHRWPVRHSAQVIPYLRQSAALDEAPERAETAQRVLRLAFFGQLREGKGIRIFLGALGALEPGLLDGVELIFLGSQRGRWTSDHVLAALSPAVKQRLAEVRFEPQLEREAALVELLRPGTLAVMPSLLDNAPNTVSECIEHGIPFVATETGGIPELVADADRERVLCRPTADGVAEALTRALTSGPVFEPAQPAREPREALAAWLHLVESVETAPARAGRAPRVVAVVATSREGGRRARQLAQSTHSVEVDVVEAESRRAGLFRTRADWILFLDEEDAPDDEMLEVLVAAQAASGADVVTPAVRPADDPGATLLFLGDPASLGLVENQYGVLGLVRSSLAVAEELAEGSVDPDWPFFARLSLAGAKIVSLPEVLATHAGQPGRVGDVPGEGLAILRAFEESSTEFPDLPQLAATLFAALARQTAATPHAQPQPPAQQRARRIASLVRARLAQR
jgi:glycosyltransferase involved in cell wall biosynthesis